MTSSNGNIFRVTGHLCGEFTGPGEFPSQRPVTRSFDVFFDLCLNKRLSKQSWGWWYETLSRQLWRHRNGVRRSVGLFGLFFYHFIIYPSHLRHYAIRQNICVIKGTGTSFRDGERRQQYQMVYRILTSVTGLYLICVTHWDWVTHICASKLTSIGSNNGVSPSRC